MMKTKTSYALHMAHYLQSHAAEQQPLSGKNKPQTWSERLRLAWFFVKFNEALKDGVVTFSFWKKDGSIREAKGTTLLLLVPKDKQPKGMKAVSHQPSVFLTLTKANGGVSALHTSSGLSRCMS